MFGEVIEEGRSAHREGGALADDLPRHLLGHENVLEDGRRAKHDGEHQAVHEAELVGHRRRHVNDRIGRQAEPLGEGAEVGEHGVDVCITPLGSPVVPEV